MDDLLYSLLVGQEWRLRAACRAPEDLPSDARAGWTAAWFPEDELPGPGGPSSEVIQALRAAKTVCLTRCPVKHECALYAREHRCYDGVWGGMHGRTLRVWIRNGKRRVNARDEVAS